MLESTGTDRVVLKPSCSYVISECLILNNAYAFSIIDSIERILDCTSSFNNAEEFSEDNQSFDAIIRNFIVIGEMVDKLSNKIKVETVDVVDWRKLAGFRNTIAHDYFKTNAKELKDYLLTIPEEAHDYMIKTHWEDFERRRVHELFQKGLHDKIKEVLVDFFEDDILKLKSKYLRLLDDDTEFFLIFTFIPKIYRLLGK